MENTWKYTLYTFYLKLISFALINGKCELSSPTHLKVNSKSKFEEIIELGQVKAVGLSASK